MYTELLENLLMEQTLARKDVGQRLGLSAGAVSKYVRWLVDQQLVLSEARRRPWSKRPVEDLSVNPNAGQALAVVVTPSSIETYACRLDAKPFCTQRYPVACRNQAELLATISQAVTEARGRVDGEFDVVSLAVDGYAANDTVFGMEGIADWQPCQPGLMLLALEDCPLTSVHPLISCKLRGLARELGVHDRLGYVVLRDGRFQIATLSKGRIVLGGQGTTSPLIHQQVSDEPVRCFCGRTGCLAGHIANGTVDGGMLGEALAGIFTESGIAEVGVEIDAGGLDVLQQLGRHLPKLHAVGNGDQIARQGQCLRAAGEALAEIVNKRRSSSN